MAIRVLGVDSRREAALILNEIEAAQGTLRRSPTVQYGAAAPPRIAHVSEGAGPALDFVSDISNLAATHKRPAQISVMDTQAKRRRSTGAASDLIAEEKSGRRDYLSSPPHLTTEKKVLIIVLTALLSAMAFATVVSGFAALSLLLTDESSTR